jgi:signal peptidase II
LKKPIALIIFILVLDQLLKFWIKTNMIIGEEIRLFDWFIIHFTENKGMAFGMEFGGKWGKYLLSIFRILAIGGIAWYLNSLVKANTKTAVVMSIALILAGAIGNMIDSAFYGMIFSHSFGQTATFMLGGYAGFLQGSVVDMFYFPIINSHFPDWLPFWGGDHFIFFRHIFNIADSAISIGVINLLLFHRSFFK